jgi:hypothetical protein
MRLSGGDFWLFISAFVGSHDRANMPYPRIINCKTNSNHRPFLDPRSEPGMTLSERMEELFKFGLFIVIENFDSLWLTNFFTRPFLNKKKVV